MKKLFLGAATIIAMLSSCANQAAQVESQNNGDTVVTDTIQSTVKSIESIYGDWKIASLKDMMIQPLDTNVCISFTDSSMSAKAGCNIFGGMLDRRGRSMDFLAFDNVFSTMMLCPEMDKEQKLTECLAAVRKFAFEGDTLVLADENDQAVIKAVK